MQSSTPATESRLKQDLLEHARAFLAEERGIEPESVQLTTRVRDDLDLDSLDLVELMMKLEETFGGGLDSLLESDAVLDIPTVGDAIDLAAKALRT